MIRGLLKWILKVYPASKLFNYIADGLKSKNSKTRTECLGEIAYLISIFGENVCQPSPAKALPAIAAQIADRDNGVRNAALNAIVEVYNLVGETVYKYLGRVSKNNCKVCKRNIFTSISLSSISTLHTRVHNNLLSKLASSELAGFHEGREITNVYKIADYKIQVTIKIKQNYK